MKRVLFAETAVFVQLDAIGGVFLVLHGVVIALFALGASQHDLAAGNARHVRHLLLWGIQAYGQPLTRLPGRY